MIQNLEVAAVHMDLTPELKAYARKKLARLDRFMPRHVRESARLEVLLKEAKIKTKRELTCEVIVRLPRETITIKESTINMFAAIDIVEAKLKNRLKKYKETHTARKLHRRLLARFRRGI